MTACLLDVDYYENENKNQKVWCVYMHTNLFNGKKYIGITSQKPEDRWRGGKGYIKSPYFWKAIKKYGWDNFKHEILLQNETFEYACKVEKCLIRHFKTRNENYGYNMTDGGEGMNGWCPSVEWRQKQSKNKKGKPLADEVKRKISIANSGKITSEETKRKISEGRRGKRVGVDHPQYGTHRSEETKKKISKANKGKLAGENHPFFGIQRSEETKEKIRQAHIGTNLSEETKQKISNWQQTHPQDKAKFVKCIETGVIYNSINAAQKELNITHIGDCCRGKLKTAGGLHFEFIDKGGMNDGNC